MPRTGSGVPVRRPAANTLTADEQPPATFPPWVEVPHLADPQAAVDGGDPFARADGPRSFLDPPRVDQAEPAGSLPPRANPRVPLLADALSGAGRLARPSSLDGVEPAGGRAGASPNQASAGAAPGADPTRSPQDRTETDESRPRPADPSSKPGPPVEAARVALPAEVAIGPASPVTAPAAPGHVATIEPDFVPPRTATTQETARLPETARIPEAVIPEVPALNPGPARHARSYRRQSAFRRIRGTVHGVDRTDSITGSPRPIRPRIDAGAVAGAPLRRAKLAHPGPITSDAVPSPSWALPSALAPTD